jgi:hypothetical protein
MTITAVVAEHTDEDTLALRTDPSVSLELVGMMNELRVLDYELGARDGLLLLHRTRIAQAVSRDLIALLERLAAKAEAEIMQRESQVARQRETLLREIQEKTQLPIDGNP